MSKWFPASFFGSDPPFLSSVGVSRVTQKLLTVHSHTDPSVNPNAAVVAAPAEVQPSIGLLHPQDVQPDPARPVHAGVHPSCGLDLHRVFREPPLLHGEQRQQLVRAQPEPGDVRPGRHVAEERDVLPGRDDPLRARGGGGSTWGEQEV